MTNAQFIFESLTKQDMTAVVVYMKENKTMSLNDAINWLFEVIYVDGEDVICERDHDLPSAAHMRQFRIDILAYSGYDNDDEVLPF